MICYKCGTQVEKGRCCTACGADLSFLQKIYHISNAYYNEGLNKASVRNLSGAVVSLRQSLKFNKYNTDARNLLGLVYYELGESVDALSEWVISANYQRNDNAAVRYLQEIHTNRGQLETINQTSRKFNQALIYCQQGSKDLAVIQLKKVLSLNPKLVKGHQLLALLYIQDEQYDKAKKCLRSAGKIDTDNTTTLRYLKEVETLLKKKGNGKKKKKDDLISYQSGNETIIMPKRFRESSIGSTLIYIVLGLVVGAAVTSFLIVPNVKNQAREETKAQLLDANDKLSTNGQTISELEKQVEAMQKELEVAKTKNDEVQTQFTSYEELLAAFEIYMTGDVEQTGEKLDKIETKYLSENAINTLNSLNEFIYEDYMKILYHKGYSAYARGNYEEAIKYLKKTCKRDKDYKAGDAAYYLAQSYNKNGQLDKAKPYYQYMIDNYPGSQRARTAANYVDAGE